MIEKPILFKGDMVRAILEGRKTQTRRIVNPPPPKHMDQAMHVGAGSFDAVRKSGLFRFSENKSGDMWPDGPVKCPYGQPGNRLWVRETTEEDCAGSLSFARYSVDQLPVLSPSAEYCEWWYSRPTCPSIHQPRWASRITLEITDVRVERLQDISEEDAQTEGVEQIRGGYWKHYDPGWTQHQLSARGSFVTLWNSINGTGSWDANPWVWVVKFRRVEQ